ncbi:MAG TPA: DNA-formamidopyrimidine glycosylase family protein, partial [Bacteroidia bacterium]|nr:DNA-formamidopyrimidine glycosylase family protein [Bacteroidia bacterium]
MPELAEVEYYRKQWDPGLGGTVECVWTHPAARIYRDTPAAAIERGLAGRCFVSSHAHGKQMLFGFSGGAWLGLHLGMTGELGIAPAGHEPGKHEHLVIRLGNVSLVFADPRMFGRVTLDLVA